MSFKVSRKKIIIIYVNTILVHNAVVSIDKKEIWKVPRWAVFHRVELQSHKRSNLLKALRVLSDKSRELFTFAVTEDTDLSQASSAKDMRLSGSLIVLNCVQVPAQLAIVNEEIKSIKHGQANWFLKR